MSTFGENVKVRRVAAGLSGSELARRAGISHGHLWKIEAGSYEPQLSVALAIADALGVSIAELTVCQSGSEAKSGTAAAKSDSRTHKRIGK